MILAQVTQVVADAPWWGPYLIGGTGVVVGALLTQVATFFNDRRKIKADREAKRRDRSLDALGEFMAACEAAAHVRVLSITEIRELEDKVVNSDFSEDAIAELTEEYSTLETDVVASGDVVRNELAAVTRAYTVLTATASPKTLGYAAALNGTVKTMVFNQDDKQLRLNYLYLLHHLPHIAREESGLKSEVDTKIPKEIRSITDYTTKVMKN